MIYFTFTIIGSNIIFNIIEYFSFINLSLLYLFSIIILFYILINSSLLYYGIISYNHTLIEFISTLFSLMFLVIMITPALIILLDVDLIIIPSYIIYSLGIQWAWQFNLIFIPLNHNLFVLSLYSDHYIISMKNKVNLSYPIFKGGFYEEFNIINNVIKPTIAGILIYNIILIIYDIYSYYYPIQYPNFGSGSSIGSIDNIKNNDHNWSNPILGYKLPLQYQPINYLFDIFQYILLPIYSFIRLIVSSFDVIHTIGFYSLGIKIDAIPGKINSTTTLRLLIKGEYRGKCFELCGQGHLLMMSSTIVYCIFIIIYT